MKTLNINATTFLSALAVASLLSLSAGEALSDPKRTNPANAPKRANPTQTHQNTQQPGLVLGTPFSAKCASGFTKAGQQKLGNGDMDWYVCSTPVITCPSYTQKNGLKAHVTPKAIVQMIGGSPDSGGPQKFRVQYKCDYSFNAKPVG